MEISQMGSWFYITSRSVARAFQNLLFCLLTAAASFEARPPSRVGTIIRERRSVGDHLHYVVICLLDIISNATRQKYLRFANGQVGVWDMVQLIATCSLIQAIRRWKKRNEARRKGSATFGEPTHGIEKPILLGSKGNPTTGAETDADRTDPGLLRKHSSFKSYTTSRGTYPAIRTFYRPHSQADKLPSEPSPLPMLVFVHGLGGSLAQFHPLLTSLVNVAPCLGIDFPGCGLSKFSPTTWDHYTPNALAELLSVVIREHCYEKSSQGIVLIGHSMGCSIAALLTSAASPVQAQSDSETLALIAICPKASLPTKGEVANYKTFLRIPNPIFDLWRHWDRRGGPESPSVARFVGPNAEFELKKLQERFNMQSRTAVWRRMAWGLLPTHYSGDIPCGGLPGLEVWSELKVPVFLIAGEADNITKVSEISMISRAIRKVKTMQPDPSKEEPLFIAGPASQQSSNENSVPEYNFQDKEPRPSITETTFLGEIAHSNAQMSNRDSGRSKKRQVLKPSILPAPASHALLYDPATYRTLAGLIQTFLHEHVDSRLSLGWQLQHLSTEGKWDVKNLVKWQGVRPVSEPIAGVFRAMKTLREIDDSHSPEIFVRDWKGKIKAVVDISHESPVYDPKGLEDGGIEYHKFPTVSKIPPTVEEVEGFNKLVDRLRRKPSSDADEDALIGVHCHYGFNRTGFFICCYLIEEQGFGVQQAIDEFRMHRPPGIRHEHFLDTLFVRHCVGLKRTPTL